MARYRMEDGTIVDTANASQSWEPASYWDGNNTCDVHTRSQWVDQYLHRSRKGRYYTETHSRWQGSTDHAEWISHEEAARWLLMNDSDIPQELETAVESVIE